MHTFNWIRLVIFLAAAGIHGLLIFGIAFHTKTVSSAEPQKKTIKLLDLREEPVPPQKLPAVLPSPPAPEPPQKPPPQSPPKPAAETPSPPQHKPEVLAERLIETEEVPVEPVKLAAPETPVQREAAAPEAANAAAYIRQNFKYIQRRIRDKLVYPPQARRTGVQGVTEVTFTLHQDGRVSGVSVAVSSGQEILDTAAVAAIYAAAPFRPPPPIPVRMVIPVVFKLR